jgi:hypothetical protein
MTTTGPNNPSANTQTSAGKPMWTNGGNVYSSNNSYATASPLGTSFSTEDLIISGFGFSITGTDTINGVTVEIERKSTTVSGTTCKDSRVFLTKNASTSSGSNKAAAGAWPSSDAYATYGSSSDLWGTTWTASEINSSNFGVIIAAIGDSGFNQPVGSIDHIRVTVESTPAGGGPTRTQYRSLMGVGI